MNALSRPPLLEHPTGVRKLATLLFNPFYYVAGWPACLLGVALMALAEGVGHFAHTYFDGVLDFHPNPLTAPLWYRGAELLVDWLALGLVLLVPAKLLSAGRAVRAIDVLGTQALARFPYLLATLLALLPGFRRTSDRVLQTLQARTMDLSFLTQSTGDTLQFLLVSLLFVPLIVWTVALMYRAYAFSTNLRGARAIGSFIAALLVAEALSKVLLGLCIHLAVPDLALADAAPPVAVARPETAATAQAEPTTAVAVARKMIEALGRGDFAGASEDFDATMRNALPPGKLRAAWEANTAEVGALVSQGNVKTEKRQSYDLVFVNCHFAREDRALQVTVSPDARVSGFFVRPKF